MSTAAIPLFNGPSRQLSRVVDLFFAPRRLFTEIRSDKSWWLPFVLTIVCSLAMSLSAVRLVGFREMAISTMRSDPGTASLLDRNTPVEQRESAIEMTQTTYKVGAASTPLLILLYNAVYALILWVGLSALGGSRVRFGSLFAVLLYADLIQDVRAILGTAVLYLMPNPAGFDIQNPFGSNIGYYLPANFPAAARTFLVLFDGLTIWYLALIALGCSIVAKTSRSTANRLVFGTWLFIVLARVTWALIA